MDTRKTLVTCYANPDLDGVASAIAYAELLHGLSRNARAGILGEPQVEAQYIFDRFELSPFPRVSGAEGFEAVILVDASDLNGLEGKIPAELVTEIIDHRQVNDSDQFPNARVQIELVGAAATLIAEKFVETAVPISRTAAVLLYGAIVSNTLSFRGSVTTGRDIESANWLNRIAQLEANFASELFAAKSNVAGQLLASMIQSHFASFVFGRTRIGIAQLELVGARDLVFERGQELAELLAHLRTEKNLQAVFLNIVELSEGPSIIVAIDRKTKELLEQTLEIRFEGDVAERLIPTLRKEIVPLLKRKLTA